MLVKGAPGRHGHSAYFQLALMDVVILNANECGLYAVGGIVRRT